MIVQINSRNLLSIGAVMVVAFAFSLVVACSGGNDSDDSSAGPPGMPGGDALSLSKQSADSSYGISAEEYAQLERGEIAVGSSGSVADSAEPAPPRAMATVTASKALVQESGSRDESAVTTKEVKGDAVSSNGGGSASIEAEIAAGTDDRIIIRTASMSVTVEDVTMTLDDISNIAISSGGWVVTSSQPRNFQGDISIRVPADRFDDVVEQLTGLAVKIRSISTKSEDFTEEFTDVTARAQTLKDTLEALRGLFDRAFSVEDAITIQKEITKVQSDLESLEARLNFLSQSSAFSFISVFMESVPIELVIDGGEDMAAAVGHAVTYRAKFTPPEGVEDFSVTWNFGDGTHETITDRFAPTGNGDELISSPVIHVFDRDEDSPFIVTVDLNGTGDVGIIEGEDTLVTTVSRLPVIEVFAGENQVVESGAIVEFEASFTRPEGVTEISYSWNFGDGTAPVEGVLAAGEGSGQVDSTHSYDNFRPDPYFVTLTVTGQTEVGEVEVSASLLVFVRETIGVKASELDAGSTTRDAVRTLQSVGVFLAKAGLWLLILSPAWLIGGAVLFVLLRRRSVIRIPRRGS